MKYIIEKKDGETITHCVVNESKINSLTANMTTFKIVDSLPADSREIEWSGNQEDEPQTNSAKIIELAKAKKIESLKKQREQDSKRPFNITINGSSRQIILKKEELGVISLIIEILEDARVTEPNKTRKWTIEGERLELSIADFKSIRSHYDLEVDDYANYQYFKRKNAINALSDIDEIENYDIKTIYE